MIGPLDTQTTQVEPVLVINDSKTTLDRPLETILEPILSEGKNALASQE